MGRVGFGAGCFIEHNEAFAGFAQGDGLAGGDLLREAALDRGSERGTVGGFQADRRDAENIRAYLPPPVG